MKAAVKGAVLLVVFIVCVGVHLSVEMRGLSTVKQTHQQNDFPNENPSKEEIYYKPSTMEMYTMENAIELGYKDSKRMPPTCGIWTDKEKASPIFADLTLYLTELEEYKRRVEAFRPSQDLRRRFDVEGRESVCQSLKLHEDGLEGIFKAGHLSRSSSGFMEPLLLPLRHPKFCFEEKKYILDLGYLVHDFEAMCRKIKRTSRFILVDMGASLMFHEEKQDSPAMYLTSIYQKFGFKFDHVYAFEMKQEDPVKVFKKIPDELFASYHWINVGVESDPKSRLNPLNLLLDKYLEDDFIVVKLDIDTSSVEVPLAYQLLNDDRYSRLIDHFYFEHHVKLRELVPYWHNSAKGSVLSSLQLFQELRRKGIESHYWP